MCESERKLPLAGHGFCNTWWATRTSMRPSSCERATALQPTDEMTSRAIHNIFSACCTTWVCLVPNAESSEACTSGRSPNFSDALTNALSNKCCTF